MAEATLRLLTVDEVAEALRLSRATVYALVKADVLPGTHVGRSIRVSERVLADFIEGGGRSWPGGRRKEPPPPEAA